MEYIVVGKHSFTITAVKGKTIKQLKEKFPYLHESVIKQIRHKAKAFK